MAGLEKIPAIFTEGNPLEISIIENLQRENLRPMEEAEALGRMIEQHGYTPEKLARIIGKAPGAIMDSLTLNRLPEGIKAVCRQTEKYSKPVLIEIAKQETAEEMVRFFTGAGKTPFSAVNSIPYPCHKLKKERIGRQKRP